jgi:hypothetical protein
MIGARPEVESASEHRRAGGLRGEAGQSAVLVLTIAAVLLVVFVTAVASLGGAALDRTRAQTAADAAALASLDGGISAASSLAARHGATVVSWSRGPGPDEVTVTVRFGRSSATARATDAP